MRKNIIILFLLIAMILGTITFGSNNFKLRILSVKPKVQIFENEIISPILTMNFGIENDKENFYIDVSVKSVSSQPISIQWNMSKMVIGNKVYNVNFLNKYPSILEPYSKINAKIRVTERILMSSELKLILPVTYNNDMLKYMITLKTFKPHAVKLFFPKNNAKNFYIGGESAFLWNTKELEVGVRVNVFSWLVFGIDHSIQTNSNVVYTFLDLSTSGNIQAYAGIGGEIAIKNISDRSLLANLGGNIKFFSGKLRLYSELDYNITKSEPFVSGGIQYGF